MWFVAYYADGRCLAVTVSAAITPDDAVQTVPPSEARRAHLGIYNRHGCLVAIYDSRPHGWTLSYETAPYRRFRRLPSTPLPPAEGLEVAAQ